MRARFITASASGLALALAFAVARGPAGLVAADHLDAPGTLQSPGGDNRLDINDVYAFQSPADSDHAVVIMTVNPAAGALSGQTGFHPDASYQFLFDGDGDGKPDATARFTFGPVGAGGVQTWRVKGTARAADLKAEGVTGQTTELFGGELKITAGKFDDPFFFDLVSFQTITNPDGSLNINFCESTDKNFFGPDGPFGVLNTLAIVLEFPRSEAPGTIGVWARTMLNDAQIDRMGRPAINTVFIPNNPFERVGTEPSQKNAFNGGKPQHDQRDFRGEVVDTLTLLLTVGGAPDPAGTANGLTDILLPDVLTVDFSSTNGFNLTGSPILNGRQLADDVIDVELGLITNGAVPSDCVGNDSAFSNSFPYLAPANP